jgi:hypothetical protein
MRGVLDRLRLQSIAESALSGKGSTPRIAQWGETRTRSLCGVAPAHFHNTHIRRTLDKLDRIETELRDGRVRRYEQRDDTFATRFIEVSDAWLEGPGALAVSGSGVQVADNPIER